MSSKRRIRKNSCDGKRKLSRDNAYKLKRILEEKDGRIMNVYKCKFCKQWHVGSREKRIKF